MRKIYSFIFSLLVMTNIMAAEEEQKKEIECLNFGVEVGVNILTKDVVPPSNVKLGNHNAQAYYIPWHIGANVEYLLGNKMFGLSSGLRLTSYTAVYGKKGESGFYYWDIAPESDAINDPNKYVKVSSTKQVNNYLGIPLQFRIFCVKTQNVVRPYFKLDVAFNFRISHKNTYDFVEDDGNILKYTDIIDKELGEPEKFNSVLDLAYGLRVGKEGWPCYFNAEIHFPTFLLTDSPVSFFDSSDLTNLNVGLKVALQVPLHWGEEKPLKHYNKKSEKASASEENELESLNNNVEKDNE